MDSKSISTPVVEAVAPQRGRTAETLQTCVLAYLPGMRPEINEQLRSLGFAPGELERFQSLAGRMLQELIAGLDARAFDAADIADQTSMLLARVDIESLSHDMGGMDQAMLQSAVAILVLHFVMFVASRHGQLPPGL